MHKLFRNKLIQEKQQLEQDIYALECSDDRLFSNANGNFPRYKAMSIRLAAIEKSLREG